MDGFKVAFLGCGGIARRHAEVLSGIEGVEFVAFCDIEEGRARWFSDNFAKGEAKVYTDHRRMLDEVDMDVLWICLPPFAHSDEVELAAERGTHIFIEKPIALDIEKALSMQEAVERAGVKSQVGFVFRFGEAVEELKRLIEGGEAGMPGLFQGEYLCNSLHSPWWRVKEKSGGQVVEQIIHVYDIARYLMGEPRVVYCQMDNLFHKEVEGYTIEDVSATTIRFESGAVGAIVGTNNAIPGRWIARWRVVTGNLTVDFEDANHAVFHHTAFPHQKEVRISSERDTFKAEAEDLLNAIRTGGETKAPISEGVKSLRFVLAVAESAERGEPVEV
ncbi:MAG TPA: Gfo/Idh/MocA family oxidoreductase [Armatimonadetes bacterium]|nr:Gfo/Idh/MocA family oxidoreductase [Armatimonadota bacterium]